MRGIPEKLVEINSDEYIKLSDEEREKILKEGWTKKSQIVKFLVEIKGNKRRTVYRKLKFFKKYIPLRVVLIDDGELHAFLAFKEKEKKIVRRIRRKDTKRDFTNLKDLAQKFGISYRHAIRLRKQGKIVVVREGKHCRVIYHFLSDKRTRQACHL